MNSFSGLVRLSKVYLYTAMTTHHQATEVDAGTADTVTSTPRSDHHPFHGDSNASSVQQCVRFMCSFGGKILPRPHDNQLRYVGGDTRIVAVNRHTTFASLLSKLSRLSGTNDISIKYQLPNEDLDALITVTTDEDVENMMEEYDRLAQTRKSARLRLFLFPNDANSRATCISSLLDGSAKREQWFFDALNGGSSSGLERGRSEASSIVSEVPDYLFGLDNSDDPPRESRLKNNQNLLNENVPGSDPGSPAPVVSSPFCSTSSALAPPSVNMIPDLPPVKTKPDNPVPVTETPVGGAGEKGETNVTKQTGYVGSPIWNYSGPAVQPIPVYYVPGTVQPGNVPIQPVRLRTPYVQTYPLAPGQVPVGFPQPVARVGQVYGGVVRQVASMDQYDMSARVIPDGANPVYYGVRNAGMVPTYPGVVVSGGEETQGSGTEGKSGRVSQAP